jgi:hypothetical protein
VSDWELKRKSDRAKAELGFYDGNDWELRRKSDRVKAEQGRY